MTAIVEPPALTRHALDRWAERFPGENLDAALARAVRVPFARLINWATGNGRRMWFRFEDTYHHDPVTEALFVLSDHFGELSVVTVIRFRKPGRVRRAKRGRHDADRAGAVGSHDSRADC